MMNRLRKDLEVLKSWGIESISVDKVLSMIKKAEGDSEISFSEQNTEVSGTPATLAPVGGTIFYIDDTADGAYEFLDAHGNLIEDVKVGDRPYAYRVIKKGSKDKYYVYHDEVYDNLKWTYYKKGAYVYEPLGTSLAVGCGKINTEIVMAKDNGAYITADSNGAPTIWYQLQQTRLAKAGGCDDWFIPSTHEISKVREAIISGNIKGGTIAESPFGGSAFANKWLWSSSESAGYNTWLWSCYRQHWANGNKGSGNSVFFARAF